MGYTYTPPPQAAGVNELWKFVSTAPTDNIELNNIVGVNGIRAPLPPNNKFNFIFSESGGFTLAGFLYQDGSFTFLNSIGKLPNLGGGIVAQDINKISGLSIDPINFANRIDARINNNSASKVLQPTSNTDTVTNGTTTLTETRLATQKTTQLIVGGFPRSEEVLSLVNNYSRITTVNGVMALQLQQNGAGAGSDLAQLLLYYLNAGVQDEVSCNTFKDYAYLQYATDYAGANNRMQVKARKDEASVEFNDVALFKIDKTGKIQSNQIEALSLVNPTVTKRVPFYDTMGALIGYIPLMVDP